MPTSTSHSHSPAGHQRPANDGGGADGGSGNDEGGGGGGGGGNLVKVAFARNQTEAEMLQGLLSEASIPSVLKRSFGFDNPDFLSSGPRDVMVNAGDAQRAKDLLAETMIEDEGDEAAALEAERRLARGETGDPSPARLAFWIIAVAAGGFVILWLLYELT
jgi:hypothetical protein